MNKAEVAVFYFHCFRRYEVAMQYVNHVLKAIALLKVE